MQYGKGFVKQVLARLGKIRRSRAGRCGRLGCGTLGVQDKNEQQNQSKGFHEDGGRRLRRLHSLDDLDAEPGDLLAE